MTNPHIEALRPYVHHHHSHPDFCGSTVQMREFSPFEEKVTCPRCRKQDAAAVCTEVKATQNA